MIDFFRPRRPASQQDDLVIVITSHSREPLVDDTDLDGLLYLLASLIAPTSWEILECDDDGQSLITQSTAVGNNISIAGLLVLIDLAFPGAVTEATSIEVRSAPVASLIPAVRLGERTPLSPILHAWTPLALGLRIDALLARGEPLPVRMKRPS